MLTKKEIQKVSENISNYLYQGNLQATEELINLFDKISRKQLTKWEDYVKMYDDNFYTYQTFNELVESEKEQSDGLTEEQCKDQIDKSIWQLPCGWYVQYV